MLSVNPYNFSQQSSLAFGQSKGSKRAPKANILPEAGKQFHAVEGKGNSIGRFIRKAAMVLGMGAATTFGAASCVDDTDIYIKPVVEEPSVIPKTPKGKVADWTNRLIGEGAISKNSAGEVLPDSLAYNDGRTGEDLSLKFLWDESTDDTVKVRSRKIGYDNDYSILKLYNNGDKLGMNIDNYYNNTLIASGPSNKILSMDIAENVLEETQGIILDKIKSSEVPNYLKIKSYSNGQLLSGTSDILIKFKSFIRR